MRAGRNMKFYVSVFRRNEHRTVLPRTRQMSILAISFQSVTTTFLALTPCFCLSSPP